VGFQPGPRIPNEFGGFDFAYPTTLYEWSYVNIPMNAEALALARSKGIDLSTLTLGAAMDTIELIDDNDVIEVDEQWLREAVKQAVQEALLLQATGKLDADGRRYATTPMGRVPLDAKASEPLYLEVDGWNPTPANRWEDWHRRGFTYAQQEALWHRLGVYNSALSTLRQRLAREP
jgi:hypothetical protein